MNNNCKIAESFPSGFVFRLRQTLGSLLKWKIYTMLCLVGLMTVSRCMAHKFNTAVVGANDVLGIVVFAAFVAIVCFWPKGGERSITFNEDGVDEPHGIGRKNWDDILGVRILRQKDRYVELYVEWIRWTYPAQSYPTGSKPIRSIPRQMFRAYFAGYVVEGSEDVAAIVERYGGPKKLL